MATKTVEVKDKWDVLKEWVDNIISNHDDNTTVGVALQIKNKMTILEYKHPKSDLKDKRTIITIISEEIKNLDKVSRVIDKEDTIRMAMYNESKKSLNWVLSRLKE